MKHLFSAHLPRFNEDKWSLFVNCLYREIEIVLAQILALTNYVLASSTVFALTFSDSYSNGNDNYSGDDFNKRHML